MRNSFFLIGLLFCICLHSQNPIIIKKAEQPPIFDGYINDTVWNNSVTFVFSEFNPNWGKKDSLTSMRMTFDDHNLYVALDAKEPQPNKIVNRNLIRDGWYGDDFFAFKIDANQTKKNAVVFSIYPSGSRYDMSISNDGIPLGNSTFNGSYDMIWEGKTQITDEGWTAEYKIPISNLKFIKKDGKVTAGVSVYRTQKHVNRNVSTNPLPEQNLPNAVLRPSLFQPIIFDGLKPKKQLQITPYLLGSKSSSYTLENMSYAKQNDTDFEVGIDIRYGISPKLTIDATLNTDFAQVEIDDQIVNLSRGNIFLPEKRRFFQEQAGLFDFNIGVFSQLFNSRNIGISNGQLIPILGGLRLTGELKNTDIGILSMQTKKTILNDGTSLPSENFSVLRLRKKMINDRSFFGFMATNRLRQNYYNTTLGFDGVISLPKEKFIISSFATSIEKDNSFNFIDNTRFAFLFEKRKQDGYFYKVSYEYSAENFNPGMASLLREKHHNLFTTFSHGTFYNKEQNARFQYRRWNVNSDVYTSPDMSRVISWYGGSSWLGRFFSGDQIQLSLISDYESVQDPISFTSKITIPKGHYFNYGFRASYTQGSQRKFKVPISSQFKGFFDGNEFKFDIEPSYNINKHLNVSTRWNSSYINIKNRKVTEWINVLQTKLNWAYNLHLSGSIIGQFNSLTDQFFTSARLRYNFKDGHDFYIVYNQDYNLERSFSNPRLPKFNTQIFTVKYLYTFFK